MASDIDLSAIYVAAVLPLTLQYKLIITINKLMYFSTQKPGACVCYYTISNYVPLVQ